MSNAKIVIVLASALLSASAIMAKASTVLTAPNIVTPNDLASGDLFGAHIAVSDDLLVSAALGVDGNLTDSGAAYIFQRQQSGTFQQITKLILEEPQTFGSFGEEVAVDGSIVAISHSAAGINGNETGAVFVYEPNDIGEWTPSAELRGSSSGRGDSFGQSVAVDGTTILVGAVDNARVGSPQDAGSAYFFERSQGGGWNEIARFVGETKRKQDGFGIAVDIDGDVAVVGADFDDVDGIVKGSAYVFERDNFDIWHRVAKLYSEDSESGDLFGADVSVSGDTIVVGAWREKVSKDAGGAAYVYRRSADGLWGQMAKLQPEDPSSEKAFGISIGIQGTTTIVGASLDDENGNRAGAAYLFQEDSSGSWSQLTKITAPDGIRDDFFGTDVAIEGNQVFVSSPIKRLPNGTSAGAVYVFALVPEPSGLLLVCLLGLGLNFAYQRELRRYFW